MFANDHDTIFALASGAGRAAIAVLRLSGPGCSEALKTIASGIFTVSRMLKSFLILLFKDHELILVVLT